MSKRTFEPASLNFGAALSNPIADILTDLSKEHRPQYAKYKINDVENVAANPLFHTLHRDAAIRLFMRKMRDQVNGLVSPSQG